MGSLTEVLTERTDMTTTTSQDVFKSTFCYSCNHGPCLMQVHLINGVIVSAEGNSEGEGFQDLAKNQGRLCPKAYGLIQKAYNPFRVKSPLKRANPDKSPNADPGWKEISWDEALELVAAKLKDIRSRNPRALMMLHSPPQVTNFGTLEPFFSAFGPVQKAAGGDSIRCYMAQHIFGNSIHGGFSCEPDLSHCNYLLVFGYNSRASGGVAENLQYTEARVRGMRVTVIDPVLSPTAAKADEWIPIRPGTDGAVLLSMVNTIVNEFGIWDADFLRAMTNSSYLVGNDGHFVRDTHTHKVLVWDERANQAKAYDSADAKDVALLGKYRIDTAETRPAFQVMKDHFPRFSVEWASTITGIPQQTIRRLAREWVDNARIGSTINLEGMTFPYRPVATKIGRGIHGVMHGYHAVIADHILAAVVGSLEAVGGHCGGRKKAGDIGFHRGLIPGPDGMLKMDAYEFVWPPRSFDAAETLIPYHKVYGNPHQLTYLNMVNPPKDLPMPPLPEAVVRFRVNPILSIGEPEIVRAALAKIPFMVSIANVIDETTQLADIVLPDCTEFERYELITSGRRSLAKKFDMIALRQPILPPQNQAREISDVLTDLVERIGFLDEYNSAVNKYLSLVAPNRLEPGRKYRWTEIMEHWCLSATAGVHGLKWFEEHGAVVKPMPAASQYEVHRAMHDLKMRYPIPYMEHVNLTGEKLAENLRRVGINWWPTDDYVPLPIYVPSVLESVPPDYDLYVSVARSMFFGLGANVDIPWLIEAADKASNDSDVLINTRTARARGIKSGDQVWVESPVGKVKYVAKLTEGIRPDTIVIPGQFGHSVMPVAKDTKRVSQTFLTPISYECTDPVSGCMQGTVVKAKVYKA